MPIRDGKTYLRGKYIGTDVNELCALQTRCQLPPSQLMGNQRGTLAICRLSLSKCSIHTTQLFATSLPFELLYLLPIPFSSIFLACPVEIDIYLPELFQVVMH